MLRLTAQELAVEFKPGSDLIRYVLEELLSGATVHLNEYLEPDPETEKASVTLTPATLGFTFADFGICQRYTDEFPWGYEDDPQEKDCYRERCLTLYAAIECAVRGNTEHNQSLLCAEILRQLQL